MTAKAWKIQTPLFTSFSELLEALEVFKSALQFRINTITDTDLAASASTLSKATDKAEKTLKLYLFQLINSTNKKLSPGDVIHAFHAMSEAWGNIPSPARSDFITTHTVDTYQDSIEKLLNDASALQAARTDLHLSLAEIAEDEFK